MHILIAPNAFKNALSADDAAKYIHEGLSKSKLKFTAENFPVGDGGDGTGKLLIQKSNARVINIYVKDPLGRKINASFGLTDDYTAIIELADVAGLKLMKPDELDPLHASTSGAGELIIDALNKKAKRILLCIGGSCTVDGGIGILQSLGIKFLDKKNQGLTGMPESLSHLEKIDTSQLDSRIKETELIILCDVENNLLGKNGAAVVFGPQKGASSNDIEKLEACLARFRDVAFHHTGKDMNALKHGGAAGGVAAGLATFTGAKLVNGIDYFIDFTHFEESLKKADIVITGEGSIDEQTLHGKAPFGVAVRAKKENISVIGFAGKIALEPEDKLKTYFDVLLPINNELAEISVALKNTSVNLVRTANALGDLLVLKDDLTRQIKVSR
ncbi:MAG TPA: glycerate kinase [Puia sp.]|nr:glycerate kinase [Puia sp.]